MNLSLRSDAKRYVEEKVRTGQYASAEAVIEAGLAALRQQEMFGDFEAGELDELLAEGERSIKEDGTVPAAEVFEGLRRRSGGRRGRSGR